MTLHVTQHEHRPGYVVLHHMTGEHTSETVLHSHEAAELSKSLATHATEAKSRESATHAKPGAAEHPAPHVSHEGHHPR